MLESNKEKLDITILLIILPFVIAAFFLLTEKTDIIYLHLNVIVLFIVNIIIIIRTILNINKKKAYSKLAILVGFLFWYSLPALSNMLFENEPISSEIPINNIPNELYFFAIIYIMEFLLFWCIFYSLTKNKKSRNIKIEEFNKNKLIIVCIFGCIIGFIPYIIYVNSIPQLISLFLRGRELGKDWYISSNLGNEKSALLVLSNSIFVASISILWMVLADISISRTKKIYLALLNILMTIIIFIDQGTRSITSLIILPALIIFLIRKWEVAKNKRKRVQYLSYLFLVMFIIIIIFQFQLLYRASWTRNDINTQLFSKWLTMGGTSDYYSETVFALSLVPSMHSYFHDVIISQFIISPIPRFLWASKPLDNIIWYYSLKRWGVDIYQVGGNVFPGMVGQYYMSWGWLGPIILGSMLGVLTAKIDCYIFNIDFEKQHYLVGLVMMLIVWIFLLYRNVSPGFLYPILFTLLIMKISKYHFS